VSLPPWDDQLLLSSALTLHLYASDDTHIGTVWPHAQELFNKVVSYDKNASTTDTDPSRLKIEVAIIASLTDGDWRVKQEIYSTYEYMMRLAINMGMLRARYERKLAYEQAIAKVYISMIQNERLLETIQTGLKKD
jgi:hypothetical protein